MTSVSGHFYDDKPRKLGEKQRLVTTDGRDICMSISDGLAYIPVIFPTDEEMESYHKAPLTPSGEWKPQDLDEDFQWGDFDNDASFGVNISANSYTQSYNDLESILSAPEYKAPNVTFSDDVAFTKGATDDELLFDIMELDTR